MGPQAAINAVFYNQLQAIEDEAERAAKTEELRREYAEDIDILHLACELVVDAVVAARGPARRGRAALRPRGDQAPRLAAEAQRRHAGLGDGREELEEVPDPVAGRGRLVLGQPARGAGRARGGGVLAWATGRRAGGGVRGRGPGPLPLSTRIAKRIATGTTEASRMTSSQRWPASVPAPSTWMIASA